MQRGGVALGRHAGPLAQRVKRYINVVWAVAALVTGGGPYEVLAGIETESLLRIFNVDAIKVRVVGLANFGAVQLRSADE